MSGSMDAQTNEVPTSGKGKPVRGAGIPPSLYTLLLLAVIFILLLIR